VFQADVGLILLLSNDRLADATQFHSLHDIGDVDAYIHGDFVIAVDVWRQFDVRAHVDELKLGAHQRADTHRPNARLEAARGVRVFLADLQCGLLAVGNPYLRRFLDFRSGIRQHGLQQRPGQGGGKVLRSQVAQLRERHKASVRVRRTSRIYSRAGRTGAAGAAGSVGATAGIRVDRISRSKHERDSQAVGAIRYQAGPYQ